MSLTGILDHILFYKRLSKFQYVHGLPLKLCFLNILCREYVQLQAKLRSKLKLDRKTEKST